MAIKLNKKIPGILKVWLPMAVIITCLSGLIYLVVQQDIRIGANDPQIQIAEDVAAQLSNGQNPQAFIPQAKTDMAKSLANYIMIFDKDGKLVGSSVILDGKDPTIPSGVFASAKKSQTNELRFTWQPQNSVRSAVVINYYKGPMPGFVLIGRSLREIEIRESQQEEIIFMAWAFTMLLSLASVVAVSKIK